MSLFLIEANVTGTDSTVTVGEYPMSRRSWAVSAVVAVTSVQPTSENRPVRQPGGSAEPAAAPMRGSTIRNSVPSRQASLTL
jgi:hypothetical protein